MGRSVATPRDANAVCYRDHIDLGYTNELDDDGNEIEGTMHFDCVLSEIEWESFIDWIKETVKENWKSFSDCDAWIDNELHCIMENQFAYIGVSTYCGCTAVWLISKSRTESYNTYYPDEQKLNNIADGFTNRIAPKFEKIFGEYRKIGTFSNGESVYEKVS